MMQLFVLKGCPRCIITELKTLRIPVYRGVERKEDDQKSFPGFFGKDGFGDLEWDWQPDMSQVKPTSGPEALARLTRENPGEISLVGLAPLTNIAEAMKLYPDIASNLKEILIMGGNDPGKNEKSAEFNFLTDPTSANAVITQAKVPITILPVEPCINIDLDLATAYTHNKRTTERPRLRSRGVATARFYFNLFSG
ncbi:unnamed protein product [Bemisia tabaci]|uniref:Inosine/uridine-preferring nucleoside hydrolase domain-containing protein n=1 Tax=Bemisia tabaci TaxID=7038 RepID=A0A9P0F4Q8_BEMTA|nr:unnamed protein product [Bemisia tabaci]